jgi:hypothetical protein
MPSKTYNTIHNLVQASLNSEKVTPEDIKSLIKWSPKDWSINDKPQGEKLAKSYGDLDTFNCKLSIGTVLARRATMGPAVSESWMAVIEFAELDREAVAEETWADVLAALYEDSSFGNGQAPKALAAWRERLSRFENPEKVLEEHGENVVRAAIKSKLWGEVLALIDAGLKPDFEVKGSEKDFSRPLLSYVIDVNTTNTLIEKGATPIKTLENGKLLEDFISSRHDTTFRDGNQRRAILKTLQTQMQKSLEKAPREDVLAYAQSKIWSTIDSASKWMEIQNAAQIIGKDFQLLKDKGGRNPLLKILSSGKPENAVRLMRMKVSEKDWIVQKDKHGCGLAHHLILSSTNAWWWDKPENLTTKQTIGEWFVAANEQAPTTLDGWKEWHRSFWKMQASQTESLVGVQYAENDAKDVEVTSFSDKIVWHTPFNMEQDVIATKFMKMEKNATAKDAFAKFVAWTKTVEAWNTTADLWLDIVDRGGMPPSKPYGVESPTMVGKGGMLFFSPESEKVFGGVAMNASTLRFGLMTAFGQCVKTLGEKYDYYGRGKGVSLEQPKQAMLKWIEAGASWSELEFEFKEPKSNWSKVWKHNLSDTFERSGNGTEARATWDDLMSACERAALARKMNVELAMVGATRPTNKLKGVL